MANDKQMLHACHALGCTVQVQAKYLMCRPHWAMVPRQLQGQVWKHYRPGQCEDKQPSVEWLQAARRAIDAVAVKVVQERQRAQLQAA